MNARIEALPADCTVEAMSPVTTMRWNPVTNGGNVIFDVHK